MNKNILVCMSGGVDSSTTAAILLEQGYNVTGVTFKLCDENNQGCYDARKVCDFLGIKHIILNFRDFFYDKVIKNFIFEYINGRTPNPCVVCNKNVKFGKLLDFAISEGFDCIATGHYANVVFDGSTKRFFLKKSKSLKKDQSYFLYRLSQAQLSKVIFPLGSFEKDEVRAFARKFGLFVSEKSESQEICFVENRKYVEFIEKNIGKKFEKGNFIDENGKVLGFHDGIIRYTIGQRRGIGFGFGKRMYVTKINAATNEVTLSDEKFLLKKNLIATDLNFIKIEKLISKISILAKIRSNSPLVKAEISPLGRDILVEFEVPQKSITPGQSVVFYDENGFVIGGGTIRN